jgi:hypothetical protein
MLPNKRASFNHKHIPIADYEQKMLENLYHTVLRMAVVAAIPAALKLKAGKRFTIW